MTTSTKGKDRVLEQVIQDDSDEWEYEYSTTETETYYLTVELSHPEFKGPNKVSRPSRGRYHKQWHEPAITSRSKTVQASTKGKEPATNVNDDDADETMLDLGQKEDQTELHDEEDATIDPQLRGTPQGQTKRGQAKGKARDTAASEEDNELNQEDDFDPELAFNAADPNALNDIQILDLHSEHPIISYRGKVFQGDWAEVIGTDMILAQHDETNPLPALRQLPQDVDLLAASSSRILTKEVIPRRKDVEYDELAEIRDEYNIKIPSGRDKKSERAQQARFLENLMAIKRMKGHQDDVTVYATPSAALNFEDEDYAQAVKSSRGRSGAAGRGSRQSQSASAGRNIFVDGLRGRGSRGGRGRGRGRKELLDVLSGRQHPASDTEQQPPAEEQRTSPGHPGAMEE